MLRVSSSGLSTPFAGIRIRRRGNPFPAEFFGSQHQKETRCTSNVSVFLRTSTQTMGGQGRDGKEIQEVQNPPDTLGGNQCNVHPERALRTLYAILRPNLSHGLPSPSTTDLRSFEAEPSGSALSALPDTISAPYTMDLCAPGQICSYPVGESLLPAVRKIRWQKDFKGGQEFFAGKRSESRAARSALHEKGGGRDVETTRDRLLHILESTSGALTAWNAYTTLSNMIPDGYPSNKSFIPFAHLHRLGRLLSRNRPKTHVQFLRLLSVLSLIRTCGGRIHVHEWNALIDHTARGWRKARVEDWENALSLYNDMIRGHPPGATFESDIQDPKGDEAHIVKPDIYTYCSLLNIAVSSRQPQAIRRAISLLNASGIPPNRITFLTLLKYYSMSRQMSGVRSTVLKMRDRGFELGLDGANACLWAYGWNERPDVVVTIYRLLRHNASMEPEEGKDIILALKRQLLEEEYISIHEDIKPDGATFATVIQAMAYHGDMLTTLSVFMDMLNFLPSQLGTPNGPNIQMASLMNTAFRAIFLGFSRNCIPPLQDGKRLPSHLDISNPRDHSHWTLENLQTMFNTFLSLPGEIRASRSTLYWIMNAFDITSGQNEDVLREVWAKLDARFGASFGMQWVAPTNRLAVWKRRLFDPVDGRSYMADDEAGEVFML